MSHLLPGVDRTHGHGQIQQAEQDIHNVHCREEQIEPLCIDARHRLVPEAKQKAQTLYGIDQCAQEQLHPDGELIIVHGQRLRFGKIRGGRGIVLLRGRGLHLRDLHARLLLRIAVVCTVRCGGGQAAAAARTERRIVRDGFAAMIAKRHKNIPPVCRYE